ncbi:MAG: polysaccharide biosynthesis/export family protein [Alistipes sp.]
MKYFQLFLLATILMTSCASQKRAWYMQGATSNTPERIVADYQIRIKPLDRLTIVVNSKDPELAAPFNTSSSYNSLSGTPMGGYNNTNYIQTRTVDEKGQLEMPIIGIINCLGKSRSELAQTIADKIIQGGYIKDPNVNVQFADMKISIIGEVARPGEYAITTDRVSILDALAMAGDLTIYGLRNDIAVIREENNTRTIHYIDLTKTDIFNSPCYYLQQNDAIYVKPNKYKAASGEIGQNRNFYLSLAGTAISIATMIITLTK